jgi:hypothetical protein
MQSLEQIVEKITTHPQMWVRDTSFNTIAAFISGYDWAAQEYTGLSRSETELGRFRTWLIERMSKNQNNTPKNLSWESYLEQEAGDNVKITLLHNLFKEYMLETRK